MGILSYIKRSFTPVTYDFGDEIDSIASDKNIFSNFIYTSLDDAIKELNLRESDVAIKKYIKKTLPFGIPDVFRDKKNAVLFRQVTSPNYEVRRFVSIIDALGKDFKPLFFEYLEDKFTDNNEWKYNLCKMSFFAGKGKKGGSKIERLNVIDFNLFKGKKFSEIKTFWGQGLVDFHHELMRNTYSYFDKESFYDASSWLARNGSNAKDYYTNFLRLFLQNGILFENFMINEKELSFTKEVFLPAFIKVFKETGKKPLIVALEPTDIEGDHFWMCHPDTSTEYVKAKLKLL